MKTIISIFVMGLLTFTATSLETFEETQVIGIKVDKPIRLDVQAVQMFKLPLGIDTQITYSEFDEGHPVLGVDYKGNPVLLYDLKEDFMVSDICLQRSTDKGETWPADLTWRFPLEEYSDINPDISFMEDGIRAYGTHETEEQDIIVYFHEYANIEDPTTWSMYYFDFSQTSTYVKETAITTCGNNVIALGMVRDYYTSELELYDTFLIYWSTSLGESWDGVIWINQDAEGNTIPRSNVCAASGEFTLFCYEITQPDGRKRIHASYANIDETTTFRDWRTSSVAASRKSNCTNPHVAIRGKNAYVVYQDDRNGNQDIYCATSTSGAFWRRYAVTDSPEDETNPVVCISEDKAICLFVKNGDLYKTETKDGGVTWSTPEKVNDVPGTVVAELGCLDIELPYGVWTDTRNGNKDIFFESVGLAPILNIERISGGLGIGFTISNVGNAPAENVSWKVELEGIVLIGKHAEGVESFIPAGGKKTVRVLVVGLGPLTITVRVDGVTKTAKGFLLGPFVLGVTPT